jgi:hypothetical protein
VVGWFVDALKADTEDVWKGVEDEPEPEERTEEAHADE